MTEKELLVLDLMGWQVNGNDITKVIDGRPYLMVKHKNEDLKKTVARHLLVCKIFGNTKNDDIYEKVYYLEKELARIWNGLDLF